MERWGGERERREGWDSYFNPCRCWSFGEKLNYKLCPQSLKFSFLAETILQTRASSVGRVGGRVRSGGGGWGGVGVGRWGGVEGRGKTPLLSLSLLEFRGGRREGRGGREGN